MTKRIIGIDIVENRLQLVQFDIAKTTRGYENLFVFEYPIVAQDPANVEQKPEENGVPLSDLSALLQHLKNTNRLEADSIVAGLHKNPAQMKTLGVPFNRQQKIDAILPGLISDESAFALEDLIFSWFLIPKTATPKDEQFQIQLVYAKKDHVRATLTEYIQAGLDLRLLSYRPIALFHAAKMLLPAELFSNGIVCLLQPMPNRTQLCFVQNDFILATRELDLKEDDFNSAFIQTVLGVVKEDLSMLSSIVVFGEREQAKRIQNVTQGVLTAQVYDIESFKLAQNEEDILKKTPAAFGYAVMGIKATQSLNIIDFRKAEFAWKGEFSYIKAKAFPMSLWLFLILICAATYGCSQSYILDRQYKIAKEQQQQACNRILDKKGLSASACVAALQEQVSGNELFSFTQFSAVKVFADLSKIIPKDFEMTLTELDINSKQGRWSAQTKNYESVDQAIKLLEQGDCISNIKKGQARQTKDGVGFQLTFDLNCQKSNPAE